MEINGFIRPIWIGSLKIAYDLQMHTQNACQRFRRAAPCTVGRRAFPFQNYRPVPWDNVYIPGWQPLSSDESTIAEALVRQDYHTGFFADVPHYFVPGMNFTRGFRQWEFIRGQAEDRYNAIAHAD